MYVSLIGCVAIPLRDQQGNTNGWTVVDSADAYLADHNWHLSNRGYASRNVWTGGCCRTLLLHREVLGISADPPTVKADHINRSKLDNRRPNLRVVNDVQSAQNRAFWPGTASSYRGVTRDRKRWRADVQIGGQRHYLGSFDGEVEAARAAQAFRLQHMTHTNERVI